MGSVSRWPSLYGVFWLSDASCGRDLSSSWRGADKLKAFSVLKQPADLPPSQLYVPRYSRMWINVASSTFTF